MPSSSASTTTERRELYGRSRSIVAKRRQRILFALMLLSASTRGWVVAYLAVALAGTVVWLLLGQRLAEQTGLRRQVWLTGDFEGAPFINDLSPGATLDFLDDDARLPRRVLQRPLARLLVRAEQPIRHPARRRGRLRRRVD